MKRLVILVAVAVASPARADETFAVTAFKQAEELGKAGKWPEACPLFEASYRADPALGVLLRLADCHERIGKLATAWAEFGDAVELAQKKSDDQSHKREKFARDRADALAPKVPKLHLAPPKQLIPGLVVKRDATDITVLVGTDMPTDPGDHQVSASAPGYVEWKTTIKVTTGTTPVELPVLEKVVVKPVEVVPVVHEGTLRVSTQANATILVDNKQVGTGSYEAKVTSGGHTLRVVAEGMRPYQSEILVGDNEVRSIDVPLEKALAAVVIAPAGPKEDLPSFELGLSFGPGEKGHGDNPAVIAYRAELALRLGRRVNFGLFAEFASISASGSCGTDIPSGAPATPFDFGSRYQLNSCRYFMPGLQLYIHILPKSQWDPYVGMAAGFRMGFIDYTPYDASGRPTTMSTSTEFFPGIEESLRAGLDYHPSRDYPGWEIGAFVDGRYMIVGQENFKDDVSGKNAAHYLSVFGGLRSTYQF